MWTLYCIDTYLTRFETYKYNDISKLQNVDKRVDVECFLDGLLLQPATVWTYSYIINLRYHSRSEFYDSMVSDG
jgi:hypothetical protein